MNTLHQGEMFGLLAAYCDAALDDVQRERLNAMLRTDPSARQVFVDYLDAHAQLHWAAAPLAVDGIAANKADDIELAVSDDELTALQHELRTLARADGHSSADARRRVRRAWGSLAVLALVVAALALWWQPWNGGAAAALAARLSEVAGEVQILGPTATSAANDRLVVPGQTLRTGEFGTAQLTYSDGTRLTLQNDSELRLEASQKNQKRLRLVRGFAELRVARQPAGAPLILATPQSTIRVLGTEFRAWASERETRIEMEHGKVEVTRRRDAAKVEAVAGTVTVIDETAQPLVAAPRPPQRGKPRLQVNEGTGPLVALAFSPRGNTVASSSWKEETKLWNTATGEVAQRLAGQRHSAKSVAFSGDGSLLAAGGGDRHISVWNLPSGEHRALPLKVDGGHSVALSADGQWLASNANFNRQPNGALVWRLDRPEAPIELAGHVGRSRVAAFMPHDAGRLITGDDQGEIIVWDIAARQPRRKFRAHAQQINALAISPDGALLATGSKDRTVRIWNLQAALAGDGSVEPQLLTQFVKHSLAVRSVAFSPDGALVASGGGGPMVYVWNAHGGQVRYTLDRHGYAVTAVAFSPRGDTVATANWDGVMSFWDLKQAISEERE